VAEAGGGNAAELEVLVESGARAGLDTEASPRSFPSATAATTTAEGLGAPLDTTVETASPSVPSRSVAGAASA
jgi:hypothetical protein